MPRSREIGVVLAHERDDLVPRLGEPARERAPEKTGRAGQQHAHRSLPVSTRIAFTFRSATPM